MVVKSSITPSKLDLGHLALFTGQRINELVIAQMVKAGFKNVRESHGYLIQHLIESERSITELARRMEVTQQAVSKSVAELVRFGILEVATAKDRRAKRIRLSLRGWQSVRQARKTRSQIDMRLAKALGNNEYRRAKTALLTCLDALGGVERIRSRRVRAPR